MESLKLPNDLLWNGKMEPSSPDTTELFGIIDSTGNWIYDDNFDNGITFITSNHIEMKPMKPEKPLSHNISNCEAFITELCESKDHWHNIGQRIDPEPLDDYPIDSVITNPNSVTKVQNVADAVNGDCVGLSELNATIFTQLTPPHSPPLQPATVKSSIYPAPIDGHYNDALQQQQQQPDTNIAQVESPTNAASNAFFNWGGANIVDAQVPEINDQKMSEMIDEFVNKRAKELSEWIQNCSDNSSCSVLSTTTDEEWQQDSSVSPLSSASSSPIPQHFIDLKSNVSTTDDDSGCGITINVVPKKRTRPYGRGVEDRKIRKKEQNKNAATRYRQKKKLEMEIVLTEEQQLEQRNVELKRKLSDCQRETKYLRRLIREFYQKRA